MKTFLTVALCLLLTLVFPGIPAAAESGAPSYDGSWLEFEEEGLSVYLPADWIMYEISEGQRNANVIFIAGNQDASRYFMLQWSTVPEDTVFEDFAAQYTANDSFSDTEQGTIGGMDALFYKIPEWNMDGCAMMSARHWEAYDFMLYPAEEEPGLNAEILSTIEMRGWDDGVRTSAFPVKQDAMPASFESYLDMEKAFFITVEENAPETWDSPTRMTLSPSMGARDLMYPLLLTVGLKGDELAQRLSEFFPGGSYAEGSEGYYTFEKGDTVVSVYYDPFLDALSATFVIDGADPAAWMCYRYLEEEGYCAMLITRTEDGYSHQYQRFTDAKNGVIGVFKSEAFDLMYNPLYEEMTAEQVQSPAVEGGGDFITVRNGVLSGSVNGISLP